MCGITGCVIKGFDRSEQLLRACTALSHRGPDDDGIMIWPDHGVGLAQRRLAIIDLSPAGRNPMSNEDGTVWITYNGEVYNYMELRHELEGLGHSFRSNTDTEVVIHAYEQWGPEHVQRLRGMFAYILYDRRPTGGGAGEQGSDDFKVLLVRDRLGIKPLFFYWHNETFLFGSEIKSILAFPNVDRSIDRSAIFDYLTYLYVPTPKTAYKHIRKLPPGHFLMFTNNQVEVHQYWDIDVSKTSLVRSPIEATEIVRGILTEAVCLHMISDVPVGVFLSGGIDSSSVSALMARAVREPILSFSIDFDVPEHSETEYARLVADHLHTQHHEHLVDVASAQTLLPQILQMYDEPFADGSAVPTYHVSKLARKYATVALSGDGGDEVFMGYKWYTAWLRQQKFEQVPMPIRRMSSSLLGSIWPGRLRGKRLISGLAKDSLGQYAQLMELFSPAEKRQMVSKAWRDEFADYDDYWYFRQFWREELDPMTRAQYLDLKTYLPDDILTKVDRASMAVSLEVRPPLLDHILVEQLFSLPAHLRAPNGQKKYLLKQAVKDWLPEPILNRSKKGFSAPWNNWMKSEKQWVKGKLQADTGVLNGNVSEFPWITSKGSRVWGMLVLQQWLSNQ